MPSYDPMNSWLKSREKQPMQYFQAGYGVGSGIKKDRQRDEEMQMRQERLDLQAERENRMAEQSERTMQLREASGRRQQEAYDMQKEKHDMSRKLSLMTSGSKEDRSEALRTSSPQMRRLLQAKEKELNEDKKYRETMKQINLQSKQLRMMLTQKSANANVQNKKYRAATTLHSLTAKALSQSTSTLGASIMTPGLYKDRELANNVAAILRNPSLGKGGFFQAVKMINEGVKQGKIDRSQYIKNVLPNIHRFNVMGERESQAKLRLSDILSRMEGGSQEIAEAGLNAQEKFQIEPVEVDDIAKAVLSVLPTKVPSGRMHTLMGILRAREKDQFGAESERTGSYSRYKKLIPVYQQYIKNNDPSWLSEQVKKGLNLNDFEEFIKKLGILQGEYETQQGKYRKDYEAAKKAGLSVY